MMKVEHVRETLPPLTDAQGRKIMRLSAGPDISNIPELSDARLANAKRDVFYRPVI